MREVILKAIPQNKSFVKASQKLYIQLKVWNSWKFQKFSYFKTSSKSSICFFWFACLSLLLFKHSPIMDSPSSLISYFSSAKSLKEIIYGSDSLESICTWLFSCTNETVIFFPLSWHPLSRASQELLSIVLWLFCWLQLCLQCLSKCAL